MSELLSHLAAVVAAPVLLTNLLSDPHFVLLLRNVRYYIFTADGPLNYPAVVKDMKSSLIPSLRFGATLGAIFLLWNNHKVVDLAVIQIQGKSTLLKENVLSRRRELAAGLAGAAAVVLLWPQEKAWSSRAMLFGLQSVWAWHMIGLAMPKARSAAEDIPAPKLYPVAN